MKKLSFAPILIAAFFLLVSFGKNGQSGTASVDTLLQDSLEADRAKWVGLITESIKGKEQMRADSVFKDVQYMKVPAARLLKIMEMGYSRSLGVSCGHCHDTSDFASGEKPQKEITRQMSAMVNKINGEMLKGIEGLQSQPAMVNCTTCHRGEIKPALSLPQK